jgi:hypothetical protein
MGEYSWFYVPGNLCRHIDYYSVGYFTGFTVAKITQDGDMT